MMRKWAGLVVVVVSLVVSGVVRAQFDPPAGYYSTATGTGTTLRNNLHNIIDNHVERTYGNARDALQLTDEDPNDSSRIILVYNGVSVPGVWDFGATWNREHQWPRSRGISSSGPDNSDLFNLRPSNPVVNSNRGSEPFGTINSSYWDPDALSPASVHDRGDVARAMFYMATRYDGSDTNTTNLTLTDNFPSGSQMGDLSEMVEWHFSDPVNEIERRRNHLVFSSVDNPLFFQGNRNPFIDHPEFVWAIWGPTGNDSTIYVGGVIPGDGASTGDVSLRVIMGGVSPMQNVTLNKAGMIPTTFDVSVTGDVVSGAAGQDQTFVGGAQSTSIDIALGSAAIVGQQSGTIVVDNTDLTSAGAGGGSADGDDVITATLDVLDHAEASFNAVVNQDTLVIDLGVFFVGSSVQTQGFTIHDLEVVAGLTANLDLDGISGVGDTAALFTNFAPVSDVVAGGGGQSFVASFDPSVGVGSFSATYTIQVSDENLSGAIGGTSLELTLMGQATAAGIPTVSEWGTVVMVLCLLTAGSIVFRRNSISLTA